MMSQPSSPRFTLEQRSAVADEHQSHKSTLADRTKKPWLGFIEHGQDSDRNRRQPLQTQPPERQLTRYSIGALSAESGETVKTLRFWTDQGLLAADRSEANYRSYGPDAPARVAFIRSAQAMGFRLRDIKQLLPLADSEVKPCNEVRALAQRRLTDIETQLQQLQAFADALRALADLPAEVCPDEACHFLPRQL